MERKYPEKIKAKELQQKKMQEERMRVKNKVQSLPVLLCQQNIYPGMRIIMNIDTRQLRDLVHIVTSDPNSNRNFVAVKKHTDMRGFVLNLKQVFRPTSQVMAEVIGVSRIAIDSIFIPEER